jgi:hypothetical protein
MRYLIFLAAPLFAQTTVPPTQLRESSSLTSSPSMIRLYAVDPTKQGVIPIKPGAGLTLRSTADGWVLEATTVASPLRLIRRVLTRDAFGNYAAPEGAEVFRNGILVTEGVDFRRESSAVIPLPAPWAQDDIVVALYLGTQPIAAGNPVACRDWYRQPGCCQSLGDVKDCPSFDPLAPEKWARLLKPR